MKLSGAAVTRIKEELGRLHCAMEIYPMDQHAPTHSYGDDHRAIEDFINVLVNEILPKERHAQPDHR